MIRFELEEKEQIVLKTLANRGAMSPSQVAAETWILPGETLSVLKTLSGAGFVLMRNDSNSPDGLLVAITTEARTYLNGDLTP
jgi:DNA-binding MarR family transcriptional regulator